MWREGRQGEREKKQTNTQWDCGKVAEEEEEEEERMPERSLGKKKNDEVICIRFSCGCSPAEGWPPAREVSSRVVAAGACQTLAAHQSSGFTKNCHRYLEFMHRS